MFQLQNYFSLGHIGGGAGRLERWIPLTSNLFKWKSKIAFFIWTFRMIFCVGQFCVFSNSPPFVLGGMFFFPPLLSSIPFLTLNHDPVCVLLGERVGFSRPPGKGSTPPPPKELCRSFHTSNSGTGLACVWYTDVSRSSTLTVLGVGLYNFKECLDFLHLVDFSLDTT